jgi:hypothetical protein
LCCLKTALERLAMDVVGEGALAVDLDDGEPLPVARLQVRIAADVDLDQVERLPRPHLLEDRASPLAEVTTLRAVEDDARGYG